VYGSPSIVTTIVSKGKKEVEGGREGREGREGGREGEEEA
jgi:hypothetical protein